MKRTSIKVIAVIIISQFFIGPLIVRGEEGKYVPSANGQVLGPSFRKDGMQELKSLNAKTLSDQDLMIKGQMMTEPSMSGLTYQVHILGEVKNPGTYRITASDRLSEILLRSGGVEEQGSQRSIEVRRQGEGARKIDLLKFQTFGDLLNNPYLLDNDVIYVPLRGPTIQVVGAVMRPKEYELKNEKTLVDALELAGGFSVGVARESPIRVVRFIDGKKNVEEIAPNDADMSNFQLQNGDVVFVPHMITEKNRFDYDLPKLPGDNIFYPSYEDRVFILGGVEGPGAYPFNPYYNMSQYLSLAGGFTKMSTRRIDIVTPDGKKKRIRNKIKDSITINPGDTILIGERRIPPEGWIGIVTGLAGFGLSTTATVLALTNN